MFQILQQLLLAYLGTFQSAGHELHSLVVDLSIHRVWVAVLVSVGEAVKLRLHRAGGYVVDQLGYQAQGADCLGPHSLKS